MRISLKKISRDIQGLVEEFPELYTYSLILTSSLEVAGYAADHDVSQRQNLEQYKKSAEAIAERMQNDPMESWQKAFFLNVQKPWNMINTAAKKLPEDQRATFLQSSTSLFWDSIAAEDEKAKAHSEGRRYGAFWIPFLIGAAALGSVGVYAAGKSSGDYVEEKKQQKNSMMYAGAGALAVVGLLVLLKK